MDNNKLDSIKKALLQAYPNGYTVVCTFGKTRTFYSMIKHTEAGSENDPGKMDVHEYSNDMLKRTCEHIDVLGKLGVSDVIVTVFHYEAWQSRGEEYVKQIIPTIELLVADYMQEFYEKGFTPYFIGLDQIHRFYEKDSDIYKIADKLIEFQNQFKHRQGNVYLGWELFPVTTYSILSSFSKDISLSMDLHHEMEKAKDPVELEDALYKWKSKILCNGRVLPKDGCLIATNYNGDLHMRSSLAAEFIHHKRFRLFYYPAPSLMMPEETYMRIFEDIVNPKKAKMRAHQFDYSGMKTNDEWAEEVKRSEEIKNNPESVIGLLRQFFK